MGWRLTPRGGSRALVLGAFLILFFFYYELTGLTGFIPGLCLGAGVFLFYDGLEAVRTGGG